MICKSRAGTLIDWIEIQEYTETKDSVGTPTIAWKERESVAASVSFVRGDEKLTYTKETAVTIIEILIAVREDLDTKLRIVFDNNNYDILAILEEGDLYQKLICRLAE